ncbi:MAG: dockerin type I domain-containing protein, partial [Phycisphaerales bacterium]|nr:dockerin type I domain-containing protein [Phycisphaerales bacterium]
YDVCDIADGTSNDWDTSGVPDECECLSDITGDLLVNVTDLLNIIGEWNNTDSFADINRDGIVNVEDLLLVIGSWGPCP